MSVSLPTTVSGYPERSDLGRATLLRRLGESCTHELRDHDRNVELPEQRFEGDQYGGGSLDWNYHTRTDARQRAEADVGQNGEAPVPGGIEPSTESRANAERSGRENLDQHEEICPGSAASR